MAKFKLQMKNISKEFPGVRALEGVNLELLEGEVHALLGINGAGKSTLIKILSGIYGKDSGNIYIDGRFPTVGAKYRGGGVPLLSNYKDHLPD